jgi:hypothetical protein
VVVPGQPGSLILLARTPCDCIGSPQVSQKSQQIKKPQIFKMILLDIFAAGMEYDYEPVAIKSY